MTRRKKASLLEDVLDVLAMLPWWVCLVLAAVSYGVLHPLAMPFQASDIQGQGSALMGTMVQKTIVRSLATVGQYLVPVLCLAAAAMSAWRRRQRKALLDGVAQAHDAAALDGMGWREFELLVGEAYRLQGYRVIESGGGGPDGGVDLVLTKGSERFFVQCKQWKAYKVGVGVVRELYGVMAAKGATGGAVVTAGSFSADAQEFAQGRNIELIDGPRLFAMIQVVRNKPAKNVVALHDATQVRDVSPAPMDPPPPLPDAGLAPAPACPRCGAAMQLRTARQGGHAGRLFWGCSTFPQCRGTRAAG